MVDENYPRITNVDEFRRKEVQMERELNRKVSSRQEKDREENVRGLLENMTPRVNYTALTLQRVQKTIRAPAEVGETHEESRRVQGVQKITYQRESEIPKYPREPPQVPKYYSSMTSSTQQVPLFQVNHTQPGKQVKTIDLNETKPDFASLYKMIQAQPKTATPTARPQMAAAMPGIGAPYGGTYGQMAEANPYSISSINPSATPMSSMSSPPSMTSMGPMGPMGAIGQMGTMGSMGMGPMGSIGQMGQMGAMGPMGGMGGMGPMGAMGPMGGMGAMGPMGGMGPMGMGAMNPMMYDPAMMQSMMDPSYLSNRKRIIFNPVTKKPQNYRTVPCRTYHSPEGCPRGDNCHFIHDFKHAGRPISNFQEWKGSNEVRKRNIEAMKHTNTQLGVATYYPPAGPEPHDPRKP
jgi:hypothetical protein